MRFSAFCIGSFFLGAFEKLWKTTVNFVMSAHMEQLDFRWTVFHEI